jgi:cell division protein FtsW (lipid II flippase)
MPFNRLIAVGMVLVIIGAVLPFLIVLRYVPSTFTLNFLAYGTSTVGIFLAVIGVAMHVGDVRKRNRDEWHDDQ